MAKREMTSEEKALYSELKILARRANQRLIRLERLVEASGEFASKQLYDYLSSEQLQAITKTGRIKIGGFNLEQMEAIKRATEEFLASKYSKTGEIRKYKSNLEKSIGVKLTYKDISAMYQARELWKFTNEQYGSAFWTDFAPRIMSENKDDWIEFARLYAEEGNDVELKQKLSSIYDYIQKHGLKGAVRFD